MRSRTVGAVTWLCKNILRLHVGKRMCRCKDNCSVKAKNRKNGFQTVEMWGLINNGELKEEA